MKWPKLQSFYGLKLVPDRASGALADPGVHWLLSCTRNSLIIVLWCWRHGQHTQNRSRTR
jgi:hypothetical protein